jgi:uncharacterized protein
LTTLAETRQLRAYFLIAFFISWVLWAPAVLSHFGVLNLRGSPGGLLALFLLGNFGPAAGALIVAARNQGALRQLGRSWRPQLPLRWYAAALLVPIMISVSASALRAAVLHVSFSITVQRAWHAGAADHGYLVRLAVLAAYPTVTFILAAGEEIGWRGFALPRLIARLGFLPAALLLGVIHAVWHLPLAFTDGNPLQGENFLLFVVSAISFSLLIGFLWTYTRSILLATLFHAAGNVAYFVLQPTATPGYRAALTFVVVLLVAYFGKRFGSNRRLAKAEVSPGSSTAGSGV